MSKNADGASRRVFALAESLETRRLLSGQLFTGEGPMVGNEPAQILSADFNGDGKRDLVVADQGIEGENMATAVVLGNGDGTFGTPLILNLTGDIAVGDFNGDGKTDLVIGSSILIGHGDGTFAAPTSVGYGLFKMVAGDFNGDGKLDLAGIDFNNKVTVLTGNGNGTFNTAAVTYTAGSGSSALVAGEFNGDGKLDLAVANAQGNTVEVLTGTGAATFSTAAAYAVVTNPVSIIAGDFNGDGKTDLAVGSPQNITVLKNSGTGTFSTATTLTQSTYAGGGMSVGDFNADGRADLVVEATDGVSVYAGNSTATFAAPIAVATAGFAEYSVTGDFNGDGHLDLVTSDNLADSVSVILGNGDGTFVNNNKTFANAGNAIVTGDFTGDGKADIAIENYAATNVSIMQGNGDGTFTLISTYAMAGTENALVTGDFNGDGKLDLASADYDNSTVSVLLGTGTGTFTSAGTISVGAGPACIVAGDFNRDGKTDLATGNDTLNQSATTGTMSILMSQGNGTFSVDTYGVSCIPESVATADFNSDGRLDLAIACLSFPTTLALQIGSGTGFFSGGPVLTVTGSTDPTAIVTGDFNGDGRPDLAITHHGEDVNNVSILLATGNSTFSVTSVSCGFQSTDIVAADLNGDGILDLATADSLGDDVSVLRGVGNGTFLPATIVGTGSSAHGIVAADFNGDGKEDLAALTQSTTDVLLNQRAYTASYLAETGGVLTLSGTAGAVVLSEANGLLNLATRGGSIEHLAASSITNIVLNGVSVAVNSDLGQAGSSGLTSVTIGAGSAVGFGANQHLATLTVNGTALVSAGAGIVLRTNTLAIAAAGKLDLANNTLIVDYTGTSPAATLLTELNAGRNGGTWNGTAGIVSSSVAGTAGSTIGFGEASTILGSTGGTFAGQTVDGTALLVRYTVSGDANLDRVVNFSDFLVLQAGFGRAGGFAQGDFNYDGTVNFSDFLILQSNFGQTVSGTAVGSGVLPVINPPTPTPVSVHTASLSGYAFFDHNKNGRYDTGDGVGHGVVVFLDANNDGILESGEQSAVADKNGKFTFKNLSAGTYHVRQVVGKGKVLSTKKIDLTLSAGQVETGLLTGTR